MVFAYVFCSVSLAEKLSGANNCKGHDLCFTRASGDSYISADGDMDDTLYLTTGGVVANENTYKSFPQLHENNLQKRLGLQGCCFGDAFAKRDSSPQSDASTVVARDRPLPRPGGLDNYSGPNWAKVNAFVGIGIASSGIWTRAINSGVDWLLSKKECEQRAMIDASKDTVFSMCIANSGKACTTTAIAETVHDGFKEMFKSMHDNGCIRCCGVLDHGGDWKAEVSVVLDTDTLNPCDIDCSKPQRKWACKTNEDGEPYCDIVDGRHDEL